MLFDAFMFGDQLFSSFDGAVYEPAALEMDTLLLLGGDAVFCNDSAIILLLLIGGPKASTLILTKTS